MKNFDLSLYLVTDPDLTLGRSIEEVVAQAIQGGVTMVQLREKQCSSRHFYEMARTLKEMLAPHHIPLIINDRADIALAVDADGLHIGQSDLPYDVARRMLGPDKIIGLSVENIEQARQANNTDVDYIGLSPVFNTGTKTDTAPPLELEGIRTIAGFTRHPTVAIGGINGNNTPHIIAAGANGIAVVSAIMSAPQPREAAIALTRAINLGRNL